MNGAYLEIRESERRVLEIDEWLVARAHVAVRVRHGARTCDVLIILYFTTEAVDSLRNFQH